MSSPVSTTVCTVGLIRVVDISIALTLGEVVAAVVVLFVLYLLGGIVASLVRRYLS